MGVALIAGGILLLLIAFIMTAELRSSITVVAGRGGVWLRYATGLWSCPLIGVQLRWMLGGRPRAWLELPWATHPVSASFDKTLRGLKGRKSKIKPVNIPLKAVFDLVSRFRVLRFDFRLKLGVADNAAATALLCAASLSAAQAARMVLARQSGERPLGMVQVKPLFSGGGVSLRFACIWSVKASHIIWELLKAYASSKEDLHGNPSD